jgi:hypothetical protein
MSEQQAEYVVNLYDRVAQDNTWNDLGAGIADEIDRAMCAAEGIAALGRAADLVALAEYAQAGGVVEMYSYVGGFGVSIGLNGHRHYTGPDAIAEAAAWCRQRGGA